MSKSTKKKADKSKKASGAKKTKSKPKATKVKKTEKKVEEKKEEKKEEEKEEERQPPVEEKPKKPVKKAAEQEKPARPETARNITKTWPMNLGVLPPATVSARHLGSPHERTARGFSFGELSSAGVPVNLAKREDVSIDIRRRSVVIQNVEALKSWLKGPEASTAGTSSEKKTAPVAVASKKR